MTKETLNSMDFYRYLKNTIELCFFLNKRRTTSTNWELEMSNISYDVGGGGGGGSNQK